MLPAKVIEAAIETAPSSFTLTVRDPKKSIVIGEGQTRTHVEPSNGTVKIQEIKHARRTSTLPDLIDFLKLAQASDVCTINGGIPVEPSDLYPETGYLTIFKETLKHTDKPLRSNNGTRQQINDMFRMFEIAKGENEYLQDNHCIYVSVNPLSLLAYDDVPLETIITYAENNQPVTALSCSLAGVTAPIDLMGCSVLQNSEILAGLVLTQLVKPSVPFIYAPAAAVPNLQSGQYVTGSPESNLINLANIQLARQLYRLPTRTMAGLTDAKVLDAQAGFETMQNLFQCMVGGASIINECLGVLDSIMTNSIEKFILDEEMIGRVLRFMEGIDTTPENLITEVIRAVGPRGSYLSHPSTMKKCRSCWRPSVSSRDNYDQWTKKGEQDVAQTANEKAINILKACPNSTIDEDTEAQLDAFVTTKLG
jgi:trimethylamine---corrinoid protein Co-methyltransferase